ncbi:MAG: exonuclease SbcCD subunit D [Bacillaceae bacterium]|nr:exonuclease SbcCD subunit D [Bacillaceae bacterium]
MKIVHTADWHLGKIVHNVYMTDDQRYVLQQFLDELARIQPDAVIIAGDLYDRAIPPREAVKLLNDTLTAIVQEMNIPVLAITGNHDSPERMDFVSRLLKEHQLFIQAKLDPDLEAVVLEDEHGPVHFHLIPYLEPGEARIMLEEDSIGSHQEMMEVIVQNISEKYDLKKGRHIFVGHAFLAGGMESESEERLSVIGGAPYVDASLFEPFTYTALGHLHQSQKVKHNHIRYSGSILKYSFSEANHNKSFTLLELNENGIKSMDKIPLKPLRDVRVAEGFMDELLDPDLASEDYLHLRLLDDGQLMDPIGKLRKNYPNILRLERVGRRGQSLNKLEQAKKRQHMDHLELFVSFYENMKGQPISEKRKEMVAEVIQELIEEERRK